MRDTLVRLAGVAHLVSLAAILYAPRHLRWDEELSRLPRLLRQMCEVYHRYTCGTIIALGLLSLALPHELASGTALARAVCGYVALFWAARLAVQFTYDFRPHLTRRWLTLSYHALSALFVAFVALYGSLALG